MHILLGLLLMMVYLGVCFLGSYPVDYFIDFVFLRPANWLARKRYEWDSAYRG